MQYRTSDLSGHLLDAAVAKALGWKVDGAWCTDPARPNDSLRLGEPGPWAEGDHFAPSTDWRDAGPIIEREEIAIVRCFGEWRAWLIGTRVHEDAADGSGPTPLIAAMRAFVASKLGETVEIP